MATNSWVSLGGGSGSGSWKDPVVNAGALPVVGNNDGDTRVDLATDTVYVWNNGSSSWLAVATPGAAIAIDGLIGDVTAAGPGTVIATIAAGVVTNAKLATMADNTVKGNTSGGAAAPSDLALGNVTEVGSSVLDILGGSNSVIGSGLTIQVVQAGIASDGFLSSVDWVAFNAKQPAGSYITALTGDVTVSGPGSVSSTVNSVGGSSAANIHSAELLANAATSSNIASTIVKRDGSGNFNAGTITANLTGTASGNVTLVSATSPIFSSGGTTPNITIQNADATHTGALTSADWITFNNKQSVSSSNYITNPSFEIDTTGWNLYNNAGNTAPAYVVAQDITFTAVAAGNAGNGINVDYIFHATQSYLTPLVTVVSPTHVTVAWYNGPTILNNPTATQLKAAWDAVPGAVALATAAITGVAGNRQYETGSNILANGGDVAPINGTGGAVVGVTFTRNTSTPLVGIASGDLGKDANNRQGSGVSTDFVINAIDVSKQLQITFAYQGSTNFVFGASSDVRVFVYDITNTTLIPVTPLASLTGPVSTAKTFTGQFTTTASLNYRLIIHIATVNALAWDLLLDSVTINSILSPVAATQVPSLVLPVQPISGGVTDHMCVMWRDGATQWVPATIAGAAIPAFGTDQTQLGFATNIVGATADIYIAGAMSGFSFGPFVGYEQYIDNTAGMISPLPSPFTDTYVMVGMAISSTVLNIQFTVHVDLISNGSGTPLKGGLLSNSAVNDGTGDQVLTVGSNGNVLVANSAASLGINWAAAIVNGGGFTYTVATRTLAVALAGDVTGAATATAIAATTVTGKLITGFVSGAGTVAATDTILQAINKLNGNIALKAPLATPTFTGDVNSSTGNVLISTIGKGLQVKTGANAKIGTAVLVAGTVTVANTSVTANSRIFLTSNTDGGTPGWLRVSAKTVATSFVITSSSILDTSTVAWLIVESIP